MKLEEQVTSLELSKKLTTLGVRQESIFFWLEYNDGEKELIYRPADGHSDMGYSAFTVSELGEMLPTEDEQNYTVVTYRGPSGFWFCDLTNFKGESGLYPKVIREDTEADARAKMLIHLIEKGIVKP